MELAVAIHAVSRALPEFERYGLAADLRRTVRSIPSNIAEGFCRHSRAAYRNHCSIALGSQGELETQVELARRLDYIPADVARRTGDQIAIVGRVTHGLWRSLA
jgi:four helix bundle protein